MLIVNLLFDAFDPFFASFDFDLVPAQEDFDRMRLGSGAIAIDDESQK
jgi:hypothetical protein